MEKLSICILNHPFRDFLKRMIDVLCVSFINDNRDNLYDKLF